MGSYRRPAITLLNSSKQLECHFLEFSSHRRAFSKPRTTTTTLMSTSIQETLEFTWPMSLLYGELWKTYDNTFEQIETLRMHFQVFSSHRRTFLNQASTTTVTDELSRNARIHFPRIRFNSGTIGSLLSFLRLIDAPYLKWILNLHRAETLVFKCPKYQF